MKPFISRRTKMFMLNILNYLGLFLKGIKHVYRKRYRIANVFNVNSHFIWGASFHVHNKSWHLNGGSSKWENFLFEIGCSHLNVWHFAKNLFQIGVHCGYFTLYKILWFTNEMKSNFMNCWFVFKKKVFHDLSHVSCLFNLITNL